MRVKVSVDYDLAGIDKVLQELTGGSRCGEAVASACRSAIDRHIRKDSGELAGSAQVSPWKVTYPKVYAAIVWDVPPQIVSPRNPSAIANPHTHPDVAKKCAEQLALYAARL